MNGLFEILSNKEWMIQQEFLHSILPTLQYNITNHASLGIDREKKSPMAIGQQGQDFIREYQVTQDGKTHGRYGWRGDSLSELNEPFVNVMPIDGPITRNGGACSYGSMEIRDWMMEAANNPACQGHVLNINTPGGSAWAKNDFQQGIDYAHARGQRVIAFIDGLCASAGMYLASLCDEVYVMNPKDQLGCVGVMAAFFTMKNGDKDLSTGETYREYYDPESVDKNKEMRDIAEDEDATLLIEELKTLGEEFRADMKAAFPNANDEHLKGKIFDAKDVMDILCDGQMMLGDVIARVFNLANGTAQPIARTANRKLGQRQQPASSSSIAGDNIAAPFSAGNGSAVATTLPNDQTTNPPNDQTTTLNNTINMKEQFPALFAALQVEEMQMQEGGAFINEGLLANLNAAIEESQKAAEETKALADQLTAEKAEMEQKLETANSEHAAAIETLNAEHAKAINAKDETIASLQGEASTRQAELDNAKATIAERDQTIASLHGEASTRQNELNEAKATIAEREQTIADLKAQITELQNDPGEQPAAAPQNNGTAAEAPRVAVSTPVAQPGQDYNEMRETWGDKK